MLIEYPDNRMRSILNLTDNEYRVLYILCKHIFSMKFKGSRRMKLHIENMIAEDLDLTHQSIRNRFVTLYSKGYLRGDCEVDMNKISNVYFDYIRTRKHVIKYHERDI